MQWYEVNQQRFEQEYGQLSALGLRVSITNSGYGDVYVLPDRGAGSPEVMIHYPEGYPSDPPRFYLPGNHGLPIQVDGAVDLHAAGIEWNEGMKAVEVLRILLRTDSIPAHDEYRMRSGRLSLRNLTEHLRTCGDLNYSFRDREVQAVQECMIREENASCVLLGKAGVGKTALAFKFIQEAAKGQVPPMLKAMIFYELRLEDLLASTKFVGDSERAIKELLNRPGILALFIDEIHRLISPQLSPVADAIKPEMASGKVRIIGASTHDEWRQVQDKALKRRLVPIEVGEPNAQETFLMIRPRVSRLKEHYGIQFTDEVIKTAICLGKLYLSDLSFPAKAIDILDRAAAAQTVQKYSCSKRY